VNSGNGKDRREKLKTLTAPSAAQKEGAGEELVMKDEG
jgi:hypothetical protein